MASLHLVPVLGGVIAAVEEEARRLREEFLRPEGPRGRRAKAPVDTEIELRLVQALQALVPCAFLGEETGLTPGPQGGWLWLVDPHDGTKQFLEGGGGSAVSVGLLRENVPVLGVVTSPTCPDRGWDTIAWAEGGELTRNGEPVAADLSSRSLTNREIIWVTASAALRPVTYSRAAAPARYVSMASIAYRLARIAAGDGAAAMSIHSVNEYDIAGGAALVRAAGGVLLDAQGREIVFTGQLDARVSGCFAGSPQAATQLARFDWRTVEREAKRTVRVATPFPRVADDTRLSRAQGCLLGQVIGDSLGSLVEFRTAEEIAHAWPYGVRELADGGTWGTMAGQPTDDSELALALARTMLREGGFEPNAVLLAYRHWMASQPFDIGDTTRRGLLGKPDPASESNGSLMRIAPIGVWAAGDPGRAAHAARDDSRLTHPNPVCVNACAAFAAAIAAGVAGGARQDMAGAAFGAVTDAVAVRGAIESGISGLKPEFGNSPGWVLVALQNAFYQLFHAPTAEEALVATVSAGGDTDTNGAIAGALAGALHGRQGFPSRWILPVLACRPAAEADAFRPRPMEYWPDDVLQLAEALLKLA